MKKTLFILIVFVNILFGYSECKTDVYFANGILTDEGNATSNTFLLRNTILKELYQNDANLMKQSIGKVERSYNQTEGVVLDILEAIGQKVSSTFDGNKTDEEVKRLRDQLRKEMGRSKQSEDLIKQVNAYMASIKNGNSVLVVAHSQGNLFEPLHVKAILRLNK